MESYKLCEVKMLFSKRKLRSENEMMKKKMVKVPAK